MRRRKNFFPTLLLAVLFWLSWFYIVFFTSPEDFFDCSLFAVRCSLTLFFPVLGLALFLTLSLVLANTRRGFLMTLGVIGFLILRLLDSAHYLNLILLVGTLISLELYCGSKRSTKKVK